MIKPVGLTHGHYECRSFDETVPILKDLLALEVVADRGDEVILKHPNTGWLLVVHEGGSHAPDKPLRNHYGVRVATNREVDEADRYLEAKKADYRVLIMKPRFYHLAYSVHFFEPGGNWWEIESYEAAAKKGLGANVSTPWKTPLPPEKFPGKGYVPQALTHGTIECDNLEASRRFYKEILGLDVVSPLPNVPPRYIKHPSTPWYIVSLEVPEKERQMLGPRQRFTLSLESGAAVETAHRWLKESARNIAKTELGEIQENLGAASFLLKDHDRNWWEITSSLQ